MNQEVTQLIVSWQQGNQVALEKLLPIVSAELHKLAVHHMKKENSGHTLQATALVNEAYMRLANSEIAINDRVHFLAMASRLMRNVLVDHARAKLAQKREHQKVSEEAVQQQIEADSRAEELVIANQMIEKLELMDERASRILEMSVFGGMTQEEIAEVEAVSLSTVARELRAAKAWLRSQMLENRD